MRRIVVVGGGHAAAKVATRVRRMVDAVEVNLLVPEKYTESTGPFGAYAKSLRPSRELLKIREVGVLETDELDIDFVAREVRVSSQRGRLPIRFDQLVLEIDAIPRMPRALHRCGNVFLWPAGDPGALDALLARPGIRSVVVMGGNWRALELVGLLLQSGVAVSWARTTSFESMPLDADMWFHVQRLLVEQSAGAVQVHDWSSFDGEEIRMDLGADGSLCAVCSPEGCRLEAEVFFRTEPQRAVHPIVANEGIELAEDGLLAVDENCMSGIPGVYLVGSGVSGGSLRTKGRTTVAGREAVLAQARHIADVLAGVASSPIPPVGSITQAFPGGLLLVAGMSLEQARSEDVIVESAMLAGPLDSVTNERDVAVKLTVEKASRQVVGVQVVTWGEKGGAEAAAAAGALAVHGKTTVDTLAALDIPGAGGRLLCAVARIVVNKMLGKVYGITPEELMASRAAGAEFFTLDLRSVPEWRKAHISGAYNIPLPQLKERLQDEVPRFTPLVIVGQRSEDAWSVGCGLAQLGADHIYVLDGGMDMWPFDTCAQD